MNSAFYNAVGCRLFHVGSALACGMLSLKLYSQHLSPETYGVVIVALQIMNYLPLLDGGFRTTVNRRLLAAVQTEEKAVLIGFCQLFYSFLALAIALAALILMAAYSLTPNARALGQPTVFFLAIALTGTVTLVGFTQLSLLVGLRAQATNFLLAGLNAWLTVAALTTCLRNGWGVWAFPVSAWAGILLTLPLGWWQVQRLSPGIKMFDFRMNDEFRRQFNRLKADAWACFRSQISITVLFSVDLVLVGLICSARDAAVYGVLSRLFGVVRAFLQSTSESAWPLVAQGGNAGHSLTPLLLRFNAWIYGGVTGALCLTLIPFMRWFMGEAWIASPILVWLLAARFLISGVSGPAAYHLLAVGNFRALARCTESELLAALVLGVALGWKMGMDGVAWGFLAATLCGALFPIFYSYARITGLSTARVMAQVWWRVLLGLATSLAAAWLVMSLGIGGFGLAVAGALCAAMALVLAAVFACVRIGLRKSPATAPAGWKRVLESI